MENPSMRSEPDENSGQAPPRHTEAQTQHSEGQKPVGHQQPRRPSVKWGQYAAVVAVSVMIGILFIHEPGFGDDFTYWSLAFNLHEVGPAAWQVDSFHDLRWPVWGMIWLSQSVFGPGLVSYYSVPLFYLAAAATIVFAFARILGFATVGSWLSVLALLFAPVLDVVIFRPMPDLSEAVFGGCAVLAWWAMMHSGGTRRSWWLGLLSGLSIGVAFSNRATGIFIAPVLALGTVTLFPRGRWKWLLLPAVAASGYFLAECLVYSAVCGDWLHSIHANLGGTRAKDVEPIAAWALPFRYLGDFIHGNRLGLSLIHI